MRARALAGAAMVAAVAVAAAFTAEPHKRIVALNPSIVEIVYELGGQDSLVGISSYSDYPAEAKRDKPLVGGLVDIDVERIVSLAPDIILHNPSVSASEKLSALGIPTEVLPNETVRDIAASFERVGELIGKREDGVRLAEGLQSAVAGAKEKSKDAAKVKVLAVIGYEPLWVAGGTGYLNELIEAVGAENVAGDVKQQFYAIDFERVLAKPPTVIIDLTLEDASLEINRAVVRSFWEKYPEIPAVSESRITFVDSDLLTIPGPRIVKGLEALEKVIRAQREAPPDTEETAE